jgi:hypothetical protein
MRAFFHRAAERFVMAGLMFLYATIAVGSALIYFAFQ